MRKTGIHRSVGPGGGGREPSPNSGLQRLWDDTGGCSQPFTSLWQLMKTKSTIRSTSSLRSSVAFTDRSSHTQSHATRLAIVSLQASLQNTKSKHEGAVWRTQREVAVRQTIAWTFNVSVYVLAGLVVLTYGVKALGPSVMSATLRSWLMGMAQCFLIVEPLQVFIVAAFPFLVNDETHFGRCLRRVQSFYNEYMSP